jgi:hypothetical protein
MTVEAVEPSAPAHTRRAHARARERDGRFHYILALAVSFAFGLVSLHFVPSNLGYDPWSWLIWGRELAHGQLATSGAASSVKPFPMAVDIFASLAGHHAPAVWLVVARAGTTMAFFLSYRLGSRLAGWPAGIIAAVGFATSATLLGYMFQVGMAEPVGVAFALAAVDAHMSGRRWWAFAALFGASMVKVEVVVFMVPYGLFWLVRLSSRPLRTFLIGAGVVLLIPCAWFLPDYFSSGSFLRSAARASLESQGGPLLAKYPAWATVTESFPLLIPAIAVGYAAGLLTSLVLWLRDWRHPTPAFVISILAVAWVLLEAVMAQLDVATGAPRYLLTAVALGATISGWFYMTAARWIAHGLRTRAVRVTIMVVCFAAVAAGCAPGVDHIAYRVKGGVKENKYLVYLSNELPQAIRQAGGRSHLLACGPINTAELQVPMVAWALHVPLGRVGITPAATGTVFALNGAQPLITGKIRKNYVYVGPVGTAAGNDWRIRTTCPPANAVIP